MSDAFLFIGGEMLFLRIDDRRVAANGFTLVEVVVVILILGILAAAGAGSILCINEKADRSAIKTSLDAINEAIEMNSPGSIPPSIEASWFRGETLPAHPHNTYGAPAIQIETDPNKTHPTWKVLKAGVAGAYWFNSGNGIVRARVASYGTQAETLERYNDVNDCDESSLGNYAAGGGS